MRNTHHHVVKNLDAELQRLIGEIVAMGQPPRDVRAPWNGRDVPQEHLLPHPGTPPCGVRTDRDTGGTSD